MPVCVDHIDLDQILRALVRVQMLSEAGSLDDDEWGAFRRLTTAVERGVANDDPISIYLGPIDWDQHSKISVIKFLRHIKEMSLKETKDAVDGMGRLYVLEKVRKSALKRRLRELNGAAGLCSGMPPIGTMQSVAAMMV